MAKKQRRRFEADFKAKVLAELSQSTVAAVAEKYELSQSNIRNWMEAAGLASSRKRRKNKPSAEQAEVLALVANRGERTIASIAEEYGVGAKTVGRWVARFGLPEAAAATNGAANGAHAKPSATVLAESGLVLVSPIRAIAALRAQATDMLKQLDALSVTFEAFQAVFAVHPVKATATVGQA